MSGRGNGTCHLVSCPWLQNGAGSDKGGHRRPRRREVRKEVRREVRGEGK